jgi:hypothetical protein
VLGESAQLMAQLGSSLPSVQVYKFRYVTYCGLFKQFQFPIISTMRLRRVNTTSWKRTRVSQSVETNIWGLEEINHAEHLQNIEAQGVNSL